MVAPRNTCLAVRRRRRHLRSSQRDVPARASAVIIRDGGGLLGGRGWRRDAAVTRSQPRSMTFFSVRCGACVPRDLDQLRRHDAEAAGDPCPFSIVPCHRGARDSPLFRAGRVVLANHLLLARPHPGAILVRLTRVCPVDADRTGQVGENTAAAGADPVVPILRRTSALHRSRRSWRGGVNALAATSARTSCSGRRASRIGTAGGRLHLRNTGLRMSSPT